MEKLKRIRNCGAKALSVALVAGGSAGAAPAVTGNVAVAAARAEICFAPDGTLREMRCRTPDGWITTAATGSAASGRRAGDWFVRCGDNASWRNPQSVERRGDSVVLQCRGDDADLQVEWKPAFDDAFLVTCRLTARKDLPSAAVGLEAFNLPADSVKSVYCLPHSLPVIREESRNNVPAGTVHNGDTYNNTFSLITATHTFSLAILTPEERRVVAPVAESSEDYRVGFLPGNVPVPLPSPVAGGICLVANCASALRAGDPVTRQFLVSVSANEPCVNGTGRHIGQYMALMRYPHRNNLLELYRKSMAYLLDNPCCFTNLPVHGKGYWGSIHSGTGDGYGNGRAFYAMYGSSFSAAALTRHAVWNRLDPRAVERLEEGAVRFLTATQIQAADGAYWSMLDLDKGGLVDQAYRPWVETHASGWVSYFLLSAFEAGGDERLRAAAVKSLAWLASAQRPDGSFPKYFENGKPAAEPQGDLAWNALAFLKAAELGVEVSGTDCRARGLAALGWLIANPVGTQRYYGSFEDVGGVTESYSSSVSAHALMAAHRMTGEEKYLAAARAALSVSLAWITCDRAPIGQANNSWNLACAVQPAFGQVESVSCYYACSYTLPLMYLAVCEVAAACRDTERCEWLRIARQFSQLDVFFNEVPGTRARYGMEWLPAPFLVFSEWGNAQTCWAIMDVLRERALLAVPGLALNRRFEGTLEGKRVAVVAPKWDESEGPLLDLDPSVDPLILRADDGTIYLVLLAEGQQVQGRLAMRALDKLLPAGDVLVTQDGRDAGRMSHARLREGFDVSFSDHAVIRLSAKGE